MNPYTKYKDSGVKWLGNVPEHWEVKRLGSQFIERKQKVSDKDFAPLSVTKHGILPQLETAAKSNDGDNRKKVCSGDFVINSRSDRKGSSGVSPLTGSVSLINTVLKPISMDGSFVHNFFRNHVFIEEFYRVGKGIVADLWSTKYSEMRTIILPVPPLPEQKQIARYLDMQTAKIDKFITAKKKLIELLKEQKQNVINEAVTKGINPDAKMKNSGVDWLGDVPEHWEIRRLKHCIRKKLKYGANASGVEYSPNLPRYIRITDFNLNGNLDESSKLSLDIDNYQDFLLEEGDLLFARSGATVGKVFQCKKMSESSCFAGYLIQAKPNLNIVTSDFLFQYTQSRVYDKWKSSIFIKATIENIGAEKYSQLFVVLPTLHEQAQIVTHIEKETALIDKTISRAEREIELIGEYRTRLISDVVTGKVDVRGIKIPEAELLETETETYPEEEE